MHGAGNDFVVVDGRTAALSSFAVASTLRSFATAEDGSEDKLWPELAVRLCPRRFSIGADGLLVLLPSDRAVARMCMFNPDGTEDMCGNGLRCVARLLWEEMGKPEEDFEIEALTGLRRVRVFQTPDGEVRVTADMGPPVLGALEEHDGTERARWECSSFVPSTSLRAGIRHSSLPLRVLDRDFEAVLVSTGSPHAVIIGQGDLSEEEWARYSSALELHPAFPERMNATWVSAAVRPHPPSPSPSLERGWPKAGGEVATRYSPLVPRPSSLAVRTWERAVGETLACGTAAAAVVVAATLVGLADREAEIRMRGGTLHAQWREDDGHVLLTGPAERVFAGEIELSSTDEHR